MSFLLAIFFSFKLVALESQGGTTLRDGSFLYYDSTRFEIADALKSMGQNFFLVEDKISKSHAVLLSQFQIMEYQGKPSIQSWCEGSLKKNICRISNEKGNIISIISPHFNKGVATIHSLSYSGKTNPHFENFFSNLRWATK